MLKKIPLADTDTEDRSDYIHTVPVRKVGFTCRAGLKDWIHTKLNETHDDNFKKRKKML